MKIKYLVISVFMVLCAFSFSANAAVKDVPEVSLLNFVSLQYDRVGGFAGISSGLSVHSGMLWVTPNTRPNKQADQQSSYPLSFNQQIALFNNINAARILEIAGDYRQRNVADGFNETLTLTISDENDRDQQFVIKNYGDTAPRNYYQFIDYLNELRDQKTGQTKATQSVDKENFQSLTLSTSGGIARIQSQVEIDAPDKETNSSQWMISSNEKRGRRTVRLQTNINVHELDALFQSLDTANLEKMNGKNYRQPGLFDGFNNTLTVTLRNGQKFTVDNYGDQAPAGFYKILEEVNRLKEKKLQDK